MDLFVLRRELFLEAFRHFEGESSRFPCETTKPPEEWFREEESDEVKSELEKRRAMSNIGRMLWVPRV